MKKFIIILGLLVLFGSFGIVKTAMPQEDEIVGTFFGNPVSKGNYYFVLKIVLSFRSPWGSIPNNREQLEKRVWDDLILSYEAHRRQISVDKEEVYAKIGETLKGDKVSFDRIKDPEAYAQWVRETLRESVEMFENQMRHLVQLKKLHKQIMESIDPAVTEEEAFQEFLNENNSLSVELAEFDGLEEAQEFYDKVQKNPDLWKEEVKKDRKREKGDRVFRRPGFVALEFLIQVWEFPKKAVFDMIEMETGAIYPPAPIYKGYGVFKILEIRQADESMFSKRRESYFNQLRNRGKYEGFKDWLKKLRIDADLQAYIEPPIEIFP